MLDIDKIIVNFLNVAKKTKNPDFHLRLRSFGSRRKASKMRWGLDCWIAEEEKAEVRGCFVADR